MKINRKSGINRKPVEKPRTPTQGFTLVEVMLVVVIIACLAAIAFPNIARARQNADDAKTQADLHSIYAAMVTFHAVNNHYPVSWDELRPYITVDESKYELNPS